MTAVQNWLEGKTNWLLVLDNADDLKMFKKTYSENPHDATTELFRFIPRQTGSILWTSRDESIDGGLVAHRCGIHLGEMDLSESVRLLRGVNGGDQVVPTTIETALLRELDHLPLAIRQAATYLSEVHLPIDRYLTRIQADDMRLLDREFPDNHRESDVPNSVMKTWLISIKQITVENPTAVQLLYIASYFDPQGIPFELLCKALTYGDGRVNSHRGQSNSVSTEEEEESDQVYEAISYLRRFSFLQEQTVQGEQDPTYDMHRLVQTATRQYLQSQNQDVPVQSAIEIVAASFPNGSYETWKTCQLYLAHALRVCQLAKANEYRDLRLEIMWNCGSYLCGQGRSSEAEQLQVQVLALLKEVLGPKHPNTLTSMNNLALTYSEQGRSSEAEQLQVQILALRKEVLGPKHPDTLNSMNSLASTYSQQGRSSEAEQLQVQVLALQKEVLGPKHPNTLTSMGNLAAMYRQQGRSSQAE